MTTIVLKYTAKGKTISRSLHHKDMWVIDYDSGGFAVINTTEEMMLKMNPPNHVLMKTMQTR